MGKMSLRTNCIRYDPTVYLHCRIHHSNLELRTTLPVVAWQRIHIHLLLLDELGISNRNRFSEGIYLQPGKKTTKIEKKNIHQYFYVINCVLSCLSPN